MIAVKVALHRPLRVAVDARERRLRDVQLASRRDARPDLPHAGKRHGDARGERRVVRAGQLDVLESLVAESRRPRLAAAAARHVVVGLQLAVHQIVSRRARGPVVGQLLAVEDLNRRAARRFDRQLRPARQVLPDVVDDDAGLRLVARAGLPGRDLCDRLVRFGVQHSRGAIHAARGRPGVVVEASLFPSRHVATGVEGLAEIVVVEARRPVGDLPCRIGGDDLLGAVGVRTRGDRAAAGASRATRHPPSPSPTCARRRRSDPSRARPTRRSRPASAGPSRRRSCRALSSRSS